MSKLTKPSLTLFKKTLMESSFDPRKPGPLSMILDSGNPTYLIQRSMEMLREALELKGKQKSDRLTKAVSLIAMARILEPTDSIQERKSTKMKPLTLDKVEEQVHGG
jgi:hypothetical protein